jgi:hypothetical protein
VETSWTKKSRQVSFYGELQLPGNRDRKSQILCVDRKRTSHADWDPLAEIGGENQLQKTTRPVETEPEENKTPVAVHSWDEKNERQDVTGARGRTCSGDSAETKIYCSKNQRGRSTKLKIHERFHQQQKPGSKIWPRTKPASDSTYCSKTETEKNLHGSTSTRKPAAWADPVACYGNTRLSKREAKKKSRWQLELTSKKLEA